ncbi:cytochrome P450, partial [Diaporthe sp. PMI_573]
ALFDKSSAQTSERPRWIVSNEQLCNKWNVLLLPASDASWKLQRRPVHSEMTSVPMANAGVPFLHFETAKFLHEVAHDPHAGTNYQDLWTQVGRYTYSNFAMQAFGFSTADERIQYIHESGALQIFGTLPGSHIVDILPILDRLPLWLKPWERSARDRFLKDLQWCRHHMIQVQKEDNPHNNFSMLKRILADEKRLGLSSNDEAAFLSMQLIIGAADTSRMSTWSFLEAMMTYPEVLKRGQELLDVTVGDRVPEWEDLDSLPYVRCLMKEVWRWRPPVALGHPHTTTRELVYKGMRIPAGARLHLNAWAIHHSPSRHSDPEVFDPTRYEDDALTSQQSANLPDPTKRDHFSFGAGRRICPGLHVAERSLGVAIMRILWAFDIGIAPPAKLPLNPSDYRGFMPGNPGVDLPVTLTVRSEKKRQIIDAYWAAQQAKGY